MKTFYTIVILAMTAIVLVMLYKMIQHRDSYDKLNSMFVMNTNIVFMILVWGLIDGRMDMYIDIAISYSVLGFVTSVILSKYIGGRK